MSEAVGAEDDPPSAVVRRRRWGLGVAIGVVMAVGVASVLLLARDDDAGTSSEPLPPDALSGPGTALPDGFEVAAGSSLLGPVLVDGVDESGAPQSWSAVLVVEGDPLEVWRSYGVQIAEQFPQEGIDAAEAPGCGAASYPGDPVCELSADTVEGSRRRAVSADMVSIPHDVTGHYLLQLSGRSSSSESLGDLHEGGGDPWPGGELPGPYDPRPRPEVGEPLAPATTAYDGDDDRYVLLEGSELIAQYGVGSITGGFAVLLRVTPGADVGAVAEAYAEQAVQFEDEPVPPPDVIEHDGTIVTEHQPPGGAGGYTGVVWAVDRPTGDDYVFYTLYND